MHLEAAELKSKSVERDKDIRNIRSPQEFCVFPFFIFPL